MVGRGCYNYEAYCHDNGRRPSTPARPLTKGRAKRLTLYFLNFQINACSCFITFEFKEVVLSTA